MLWFVEFLEKETKRLRGLICCVRCKSYYRKELEVCPVCSETTDEDLRDALQERKAFRDSLGKIMIIGAVLFFIVVMVVGKILE